MTKRIIMVVVIALLTFLIIGCREQSEKSAMLIEQAQLTNQESKLLDLIKDRNSYAIFDYATDNEVKSVWFGCYMLDRNGNWHSSNGKFGFPVNKSVGRIAISFDNLGEAMKVTIDEGKEMSSSESNTGEKIDIAGLGSLASYASTENIEYEKEIPLIIQVFSSKKEFQSCDTKLFSNPKEVQKKGYEDVYVVTIKFSKVDIYEKTF